MVEFSETDDVIMSPNHRLHLDKVTRDKYVYLVDQTSIELEMSKDCTLTNLPDFLGSRFFYTIGMRKHSAFEQLIGEAYVAYFSSLIDKNCFIFMTIAYYNNYCYVTIMFSTAYVTIQSCSNGEQWIIASLENKKLATTVHQLFIYESGLGFVSRSG